MLDLNQRPPPCKLGQSFPGRYCPVRKSRIHERFLPFLAPLFSCSVRMRPAPVAARLQHLTLLTAGNRRGVGWFSAWCATQMSGRHSTLSVWGSVILAELPSPYPRAFLHGADNAWKRASPLVVRGGASTPVSATKEGARFLRPSFNRVRCLEPVLQS
jgi:hypothetical protein